MLGGFTMKRLPVVEYLSHEEIDRRYRSCSDAALKTRWHVLWLVTRPNQPLSATAAAKLVGFTPAWGRAILKRYNQYGPDALDDRRQHNGAKPKLAPTASRTALRLAEPTARLRVVEWAKNRCLREGSLRRDGVHKRAGSG